jgi:Mrp family chromosome partitioning ATPase
MEEGQATTGEDARPSPFVLSREEEREGEAEMPFIEVGPHRSMEASPSVLASTSEGGPGNGPAAPRPLFPEPRNVAFRALPGSEYRGGHGSRIAPEVVAYHAPGDPLSGRYRDLLAALLTALGDLSGTKASLSPPALLFTSARPAAGTTTVLLNLAVTAARQGRRRVVVVDANFRRPAVAQRLGLPEIPGLREVLGGTISLDHALRETEQAHLLALPAGGPAAAEPGGMRFVGGTVRSLLRQLRQRFDLVLVDAAPWDGRPDVTVPGAACDAVCLVVAEQEAETPEVDALLRGIPAQGAGVVGCVLTG